MHILSLAMPTPLRRSFDYLPPQSLSDEQINALQPGMRIMAPFGHRQLVGILLVVKDDSDVAADKLKAATEVLDVAAILPPTLLDLCRWAASYYQHPIGDALANAVPVMLRKGRALLSNTETRWRLTTEGKGLPEGALKRAAKQAQLLALLQQQASVGSTDLSATGISKATVKALFDKQLLESFEAKPNDNQPQAILKAASLTLNGEQQHALQQIKSRPGFNCSLLQGVTGSGKTEVYLQLIAHYLQQDLQALVLIPEIGLSPQTLSRFQQRFNCKIVVIHSGLTDRERLLAWQAASNGEAGIVIGTRSAVFTPLAKLGLIIIDEEHDSSFKQQEGFRYSARDVAIKRAASENCPIVLGTATPSLETLQNALQGRYQLLPLNQRATGAAAPTFELVDIRHAPMDEGLAPATVTAIGREIARGNQVLVFINRRGFAPMLMCHDCGYVAQCSQCDARLTVHFGQRLLRCHHCDSQSRLPNQCPNCHSQQLDFRGAGTERSEQALQRLFPRTRIHRIDRDTTSRKHAMQKITDEIHQGEPCILVGTQMLAKGHHFADVTLVVVLDADAGLFSADFRGPEKMGQLLTQVAGRAGREEKPGTVMIQTHQPEHPLLNQLITQGYSHFARQLLAERQQQNLPPFSYLALVRAEANNLQQPEAFLQQLRGHIEQLNGVTLFGPLPAPMTRKAGRYRVQLLVQAQQRNALHHSLQQLCQLGDQLPTGKQLRWALDVDPVDAF
ncbi:MAG: primosomal protein N' (replication factor Y) [Oceanicoccus sp.]|jgi:primosomal protein N' (replication factor Y)